MLGCYGFLKDSSEILMGFFWDSIKISEGFFKDF